MRKKYLKTPEEVIKALKEGKEVKSDFSGSYKMIEGRICYFFKKKIWVISQCICSTENPYIEEAEPLKFEVGKYYKNRAGRKQICCFIVKYQDEAHAVKFVDLESGDFVITDTTGMFLEKAETELDIVGKWEE